MEPECERRASEAAADAWLGSITAGLEANKVFCIIIIAHSALRCDCGSSDGEPANEASGLEWNELEAPEVNDEFEDVGDSCGWRTNDGNNAEPFEGSCSSYDEANASGMELLLWLLLQLLSL